METTVEWKKLRIKLMIWSIRKLKTTNQNNKKKKESKKRGSHRQLWGKLQAFQQCIIGYPKEKTKIKKLEIYLKKIMKENFPNLVKEIDMQVQEAKSSKQYECRGPHHDAS